MIEKPGMFFLGKLIDPTDKKNPEDHLFFYESKNFMTHAVCVGMTGSGKTGLGIDILEEAALNKIPAIIIDPKGDLGNLLLTFPHLTADEFLPWIDEAEAERNGLTSELYAESVAKTWREGLAKWGEGIDRIQRLKNSAETLIYTPASNAGIPLSIISSFAAPSKEFMMDTEAVRNKILSLSSGLLGLIGINADPIKSREHILISTIIERAWTKGIDLNIEKIIQQVQQPPFDKIGALDTDTFFPQKDRIALSISLNNLLASPGFQAWMAGEPLDIQQLLYTKEGKPKLSILTLSHLSDPEKMFFVTLVLNEIISWMRKQPGTSQLRALLYMDEIFGFFPPTSMPPSKIPMLTLLKQARAYGLGIMLATQNPVDLDYKGLSNCGTWFIGKLQTERDKNRVLEGLKKGSIGEIDSQTLDKMLGLIRNRVFLLRSIYEKNILLFETRWTLSYLRGPLTLTQISKLTKQSGYTSLSSPQKIKEQNQRPIIPSGIQEFFYKNSKIAPPFTYQPRIMANAKLHFVENKNKIDFWKEIILIAPFDQISQKILWEEAIPVSNPQNSLDKVPIFGCSFEEFPGELMNEKKVSFFEKSLVSSLYQSQELTIYKVKDLPISSEGGEAENEFRTRITPEIWKHKEEEIKKVQAKFGEKKQQLTQKIKRSEENVNHKQQKAFWQKIEAFFSFLATILGAILGKKVTKGTLSQTGTSIRRAGRIGKDSQEAAQAEETYKMYQEQLENLDLQREEEIRELNRQYDPHTMELDAISIKPKKTDISIEKLAIVWWPIF